MQILTNKIKPVIIQLKKTRKDREKWMEEHTNVLDYVLESLQQK